MIEKVIKQNTLGILPNIAKTGIKDVDEPKKEENGPLSAFSSLKKFGNMF